MPSVSLQLNPGLVWVLGWGRHLCTPHWHPLGRQGWVQTIVSLRQVGTDPCVMEVRPFMALPCLLWVGHKALL